MKKLSGILALLLSIAIFLIVRHLTSQSKAPARKCNVSAIVRENILFSSMLMQ
jgi:hypothetical protein